MKKTTQKKWLLTIITTLIFVQIINAQICFTTTQYPLYNGGDGIVSADFNNDGIVDLATASGPNISLLLGTGTGSFIAYTTFSTNANSTAITSADFNGDGNNDIATANLSSDNISILLGTGTGSFNTAYTYSVGSFPIAIINADFNGDGKIDLATTNNVSNNVTILLGNGAGTFTSIVNYVSGTQQTALTTADFNSDGKLDLAIANGSGSVSILNGNGIGGFVLSTTISLSGYPNSIISTDFNGDLKPDLALTNGGGIITILLGSGISSFSSSTVSVTPPQQMNSNPSSMVASDFNSDGKMDFAINPVCVFLGNGIGSFSTQFNSYLGISYPKFIISADFNGDGRSDIATNNLSHTAAILLNTVNIPTVNVSGSITNCGGYSSVLTATGTTGNGVNYYWTPGNYTGTMVTVNPLYTTNYSVIVTNAIGCTNSALVTVSVIPSPTLGASSSSTLLCVGQTATLTASINGATSFSWTTGQTTNTIQISPTNTTAYTLTAIASNGCTNSTVYSQSVSTCIGLNETIKNSGIELKIYPNPASNIVRIENKNGLKIEKIKLYNSAGKIVLVDTNNESIIDLKNLLEGIYMCQLIFENNEVYNCKIIIEN